MFKNINQFISCLIFFSCSLNIAQELNAVVLDSLNQNPIPFASIYFKSGEGVISNEEGRFRLSFDPQKTPIDSLFISCMGYETLGIQLKEAQDSVYYLSPKTIALNSIILSNKEIDVDQLLDQIKENIPEKYELGFTRKKLFFRETGTTEFKALDVKIKKSSIEEFNQVFWDSTLQKIPRKNEWFQEFSGLLYGNSSEENQKLELYKALDLEDKKTSAVFENIEQIFDTILKENIKTSSYFKVRSGIIGGKIESDEFSNSEKDTLSQEEKDYIRKENFLSWKKRTVSNLLKNIFEDEELNFKVIKKSSRYTFKLTDFTYFGDTPVYVLQFEPDGKADFVGKIYVDADQMTLIRLEYKNIQNLREFSMLGVSFALDLQELIIQFKKLSDNKYSLEYFEFTTGFNGGFERPLVITEKNKVVKGRNKQNQLKMDLNVKNRQYQKLQLVVFETIPITKEVFETYKETPSVLPVNLTEYDPNFWEGYSIIEPNKTIKAFKVIK
jgi:hypothetical protein